MKQYRLLRNNKESGPYSAEELIQSGFKPYDLIWMDGKSAAWRYPGELEEFKLYAPVIEEQPFDRFYKKPAPTESKKEEVTPVKKETIIPATNTSNVNAIPSVAVKSEKPRIRIKADSRRIEMPVIQEQIVQKEKIKPAHSEETVKPVLQKEQIKTVQTAATNPGWEDMWLNWEQEKKAVSAINKTSGKKYADETLETKFSQSLEDIKERYVETILKPKRSSSISKSGNLITVFILIATILGFGMWMGFKWSGTSSTGKEQKIANTQPRPVKTLPQSEQAEEQILPDLNNETKTSSVSSKAHNINHVNEPDAHNSVTATKKLQSIHNTSKQAESKSVHQPLQKKTVKDFTVQQKSNDAPLPDKNIGENDVAENNIAAATLPKKQDHPAVFTHFKPQPKITDFITVDTYTPSTMNAVGVKLRVQNISDIPVDMVMLDLQYYDAGGRYQTGATVYVRNIGAGQTVTVQAPDNSHAAKVDYRIAMVSSEKNNMYLIAD
jgi:hypothetical protein